MGKVIQNSKFNEELKEEFRIMLLNAYLKITNLITKNKILN